MAFLSFLQNLFGSVSKAVPQTAPTQPPPVPSDGIPQAYFDRVAQIESGGNPNAKAPGSSALGLYQFTDATWESIRRQAPQLLLSEDGRTDPEQALRAEKWLAESDGHYFENRMQRMPTLSERYLMHFLGAPTACKVIEASPTESLEAVAGPAVIRANPFARGYTCAQLRAWAAMKVPDNLAG